MKPINILALLMGLLMVHVLSAQEKHVYKSLDGLNLELIVHQPEGVKPGEQRPAMVFFFGGGWKGGSTRQFAPHAEHFAKKGMVCFLVDYRVSGRHKTTPFASLKDAKSAMRYVRSHAEAFGVDPDKIVASGGSAGGHLAAATALIPDYNEASDDMGVSCVPNALVLFNPVIDNGPGGYGFERIGEAYATFSPLHNIRKDAPPTTIFLGTKDNLIPVASMKYYQTVMQQVDSRCDLHLYEGQKHGFFNVSNEKYYTLTVQETEAFLSSLGYMH